MLEYEIDGCENESVPELTNDGDSDKVGRDRLADRVADMLSLRVFASGDALVLSLHVVVKGTVIEIV